MTKQNLQKLDPAAIDTQIADISVTLSGLMRNLENTENTIRSYAGLRHYVRASYRDKGGYRNTGTYEEAVVIVRQRWIEQEAWFAADVPDQNNRPAWMTPGDSLPYGGVETTIARVEELRAEKYRLFAAIQELDNEWRRRGCWSRYYVVTSSPGHIHSGTNCQTCRITTEFGWLPEMSGQTEAEAVAGLGSHAEALCSVCFPTAPVRNDRTKITAAKAKKMSAAPVVKA